MSNWMFLAYNPIWVAPRPKPLLKVGAVEVCAPNPVKPVAAGLNVLDWLNDPNADPAAGVNVPKPPNPVAADDVGAPNADPNPVAGFCPNNPPILIKKIRLNFQ